MNRYVMLMATHLGDAVRHKTIQWALESIRNQTRCPDLVCVSYSYTGDIPDTSLWSRILGPIPHKFFAKRKKTPQFVHYYSLFRMFEGESRTVLMFLDDDDLLDEQKIEIVANHFACNDSTNVVFHEIIEFGSPLSYYDTQELLTPPMLKHRRVIRQTNRVEYCAYSFRASELPRIRRRISFIKNEIAAPTHALHDVLFATAIPSAHMKSLSYGLLWVRTERHPRHYQPKTLHK